MADPRFFRNAGPFTARDIAAHMGGEIVRGDADKELTDTATLTVAGPSHLSFFENPKYRDALRMTGAGAVVLAPAAIADAPGDAVIITAELPYAAFAAAAGLFYPEALRPAGALGRPGISPAASIDPEARLGDAVTVEAGAAIGPGAEIGNRTIICANAVIGRGCAIGSDCVIGANVTVSYALVGDNVIIHPGSSIGQDGFGFALAQEGHRKVPQTGRVIVQENVEIGAGVCIDRGSGPDTVIGAGSKIDNLVQVAHNVTIGRNSVVVSQVGISGSSTLGEFVVIGGQAGIAGHVDIGDGAMLAAKTGVASSLPGGAQYGGVPARPMAQWRREVAALALMAKRKGGSRK